MITRGERGGEDEDEDMEREGKTKRRWMGGRIGIGKCKSENFDLRWNRDRDIFASLRVNGNIDEREGKVRIREGQKGREDRNTF